MNRFHAILISLLCGCLMFVPVAFCDPVTADVPVVDEVPTEEVEPIVMHLIEDCELVAYCPCVACCGDWSNQGGVVYTASGEIAVEGVTVAVDDSIIPLGSVVVIDGHRYKAQDTGAFSGRVIDIYFEDHEAALNFGYKVADVYWIEEEEKC